MSTCKWCQRAIVNEDGAWIDPEATGDDSIWRESCEGHDTFTAEHEPLVDRYYGVRNEYAPTFGREHLTLWSGAFSSTFEGWADELPGHDGYMLRLEYVPGAVRVACESPRTDENYLRVDAALMAAANEHAHVHGWRSLLGA